MIPKRFRKYLAVFALVAGVGILGAGVVFPDHRLAYGICGVFCLLVGGLYLGTVKETK